MKFYRTVLLPLFFLMPGLIEAHVPPSQALQMTSIAPMLEKITPAVVNVMVEGKMRLHQLDDHTQIPMQGFAVGSGVIFDAEKGYIVTNVHVVKQEKVITVTLKNGERYHANLIAKDDGYDIAVLQIHAPHLTALPFANSDKVKTGDFVTAIGSPYGLSQTVTSGVVSAVNRTHPRIEGYQSFIQTDAPINFGNSGGALVNMKGELIGINTAMMAPNDGNVGIGFAIPSNMVKGLIDQLLKYGKVEHSMLGVIVQSISPELATALDLSTTNGAIITQVVPNSPAAKAGLKPEDVIIGVDQQTVDNAVEVRNILGMIRPGSTVGINIDRHHKKEMFYVTVINPKEFKPAKPSYFGGVRLQDFNELESDGSRLKGLLVTSVDDSSAGALAGLQMGDVITAVNSHPVVTLQDLNAFIPKDNKPLVLNVTRGENNALFVIRAE